MRAQRSQPTCSVDLSHHVALLVTTDVTKRLLCYPASRARKDSMAIAMKTARCPVVIASICRASFQRSEGFGMQPLVSLLGRCPGF